MKISEGKFRRAKRFLKDISGHYEELILKIDRRNMTNYKIMVDLFKRSHLGPVMFCLRKSVHAELDEECSLKLKGHYGQLLDQWLGYQKLSKKGQEEKKSTSKSFVGDWEYYFNLKDKTSQFMRDFSVFIEKYQNYYLIALANPDQVREKLRLYNALVVDYENLTRKYNVNILSFSSEHVQDKLQLIWLEFFRRVLSIVENHDREQLTAQLEELNFRWNDFHNIVKRDYQFKKYKITGVVNKVHLKWNLVLKIILK